MRRSLSLLLVIALVAAGCTESDLAIVVDDRPTTTSPVISDDVVTDADEVVQLALDDLEDYWSAMLPEQYGVELEPLRGGYVPYGPDTPLPQCGPEPLTYDEIADNALYCPAEDLVAWDREVLMPTLQKRFGSLTVALVIAHEFGHAIQARGDVQGATVTLELQADCFAGAWVDDVDDRIATFSVDDEALDQAIAGLLELRDRLGVTGYDPGAHGSGFDRVSAFQHGYEEGIGVCTGYEADPPEVVAIPFGSVNDQASGGNLPLEQLLDPLVLDLESFFSALFSEAGRRWEPVGDLRTVDPADGPVECGPVEVSPEELELASFYCASDNTAYLDGAELLPALEEIGDFAFGGELARLYAFAAQERLDLDLDDEVAEGLHADCVSGVYAAAEFSGTVPDQQLILSPGDLDEIIIAFLAFGGETGASAFDRTAAFRSGFVDGMAACEQFVG